MAIFSALLEGGAGSVLVTRADEAVTAAVLEVAPDARRDERARAVWLAPRVPDAIGCVAMVSAGTSDGPVGLSTKHALAIVNRGGATAAQILAFAARIKHQVFERFGVTLAPEPVLAGFEPHETASLLSG